MFSITVLASGGGSNLQSLINAVQDGSLDAGINRVITDREAFALERAAEAGIPALLIDRKIWGSNLSDKIMENIPPETDLIVLAGFLSILSPGFIEEWSHKIINIHPSLLPDFGGKGMYGMNVHRAVLKDGRKKSGCSVHYVDSGVDTGEIIMQKEVPVLPGDTPEELQSRILVYEHTLIVEAVKEIISKSKNHDREGIA